MIIEVINPEFVDIPVYQNEELLISANHKLVIIICKN